MSCEICEEQLLSSELVPYKFHTENVIFVCKNHYCKCMPKLLPWRWITLCNKCNYNCVCKSCCQEDKDGKFVCKNCL